MFGNRALPDENALDQFAPPRGYSILSRPELSLFLLTSAKSAAPLAPASFFLVRQANSREAGFHLFRSGPAGDIRRRR
jgi:hypothetical protein